MLEKSFERLRNGVPRLSEASLCDRKTDDPYVELFFEYYGNLAIAIDRLLLASSGTSSHQIGITATSIGDPTGTNQITFTGLTMRFRGCWVLRIRAARWFSVERVWLHGRYLASGNAWTVAFNPMWRAK